MQELVLYESTKSCPKSPQFSLKTRFEYNGELFDKNNGAGFAGATKKLVSDMTSTPMMKGEKLQVLECDDAEDL